MNKAKNGDIRPHPFEQKLEKDEVLLWIGRPSKEAYTQGNNTPRGTIKVCATALAPFVAAIIGIFYSYNLLHTYVCIMVLVAVPIVAFGFLGPVDYERADWYGFSSTHIMLAQWDEGDFMIHQTKLGNLKEIIVKNVVENSGDVEKGTLVCICCTMVPSLLSKCLSFKGIEHPSQVRELLMDSLTLSKSELSR